jgi:3-hydroxyacyl-[acyl-carrier-protein] dehydratase
MNEFLAHVIVAPDHPSLPGHFPGRPIVPGVVLLDLVFDAIQSTTETKMRIESIVSAKFLQAVEPDQRVDLKITLAPENETRRMKARFIASRDNVAVLEGSFILAPNSAGGTA